MLGSLEGRLVAGAVLIGVLASAQVVVTTVVANSSAERMERAQEIGVEGALLAERIKFDVVQVQQWLTDYPPPVVGMVSMTTRARKGGRMAAGMI